jgi:hypothetical protein
MDFLKLFQSFAQNLSDSEPNSAAGGLALSVYLRAQEREFDPTFEASFFPVEQSSAD